MARTIITSKTGVIIRKGATPIVGENVILDTSASTIRVTAEIDMRTLISALDDYWHATSGMSLFRFPAYAIDETSAKYQIGYDGNLYNNWHWYDTDTKKNIKSGGWKQHNLDGTIAESWFGVTTPPGKIPDTAQPYYLLSPSGSPVNFTFTGAINEPVQVYGDATHGNFDSQSYFKLFIQEQGYTFASADLASVSRTATGPYSQAFAGTITLDDKVTHADSIVNAAPYTSLSVTYHTTDQSKPISGTSYPFRVVIDNVTANLTRFQIYERLQYLMRQNTDIDAGSGTVIGKTAEQIAWFVGTTLYCKAFIEGLNPNDKNDVVIIDKNNAERRYAYAATGTFYFNNLIYSAPAAKATVEFIDPTATAGDEFGTAGAVIVNDASGVPLTFNINGASSIAWTFDYDGNTQAGRTPGQDANCVIVVTAPGHIRYTSQIFTISRNTNQNINVVGTEPPYYI
jgi:hypothetical protein